MALYEGTCPMISPDYSIKPMTRPDLDLAIDWAAAAGWNPGLYDADCFYAADPTGFLMGQLADEPIAAISVVKYGATFGFLGLYIVKPAFRGQGYGLQLWHAGLETLKGRNVALDGVVAQQDNYIRSGFRLAHRNIRYQGIRPTQLPDLPPSVQSSLVSLASLPFSTVLEYDQAVFLAARSAFLKCWLAQPGSHAIGLVHHQKLAGYGVLRPCREGYKIGPLFADTPDFAEEIFLALIAQIELGSTFYLDVPEPNSPAVTLAERYGLISVFETARMYNQQIPPLPLERIFGVTTFELG
ncbi:MAG: GNAT family N-acetyltransferase [Phormidesmis sp.]